MDITQLAKDAARTRRPQAENSSAEEPQVTPRVVVTDHSNSVPVSSPVRATEPTQALPAMNRDAEAPPTSNGPRGGHTAGPAPVHTVAPDPKPSAPVGEPLTVEAAVAQEAPPAEPPKESAFSKFLKKVRAEAEASSKKKKAAEQENKKATTKKRNFGKYVLGVVAVGVIGSVIANTILNERTTQVLHQSEKARATQKATQDATALLEIGAKPLSPVAGALTAGAVGGNQSTSPGAAAQGANTGTGPNPVRADAGDPYLSQLQQLKGDLSSSVSGKTSPSGLPPEIASAEIPVKRNAARPTQFELPPAPPVQKLQPVPDAIEGADVATSSKRDPLVGVMVLGAVKMDSAAAVPYRMGAWRKTMDGPSAYLYPKNADPLVNGRWFFEGESTQEGWTIVEIGQTSVKVVSPQGKVYRLQF